MVLPLLALPADRRSSSTGVLLDQLSIDELTLLVATSPCDSVLRLNAVSKEINTLFQLPEFWAGVVNLRLERGEELREGGGALLTPFQQYMALCFRREHSLDPQRRIATTQLRLAVDTGRWTAATIALRLGADASRVPVDSIRPLAFASYNFIRTDAVWPNPDYMPQPDVLEFATELIHRGGRLLDVDGDATTVDDVRGLNMMIETAIFGLNPLLLTLLIRSGARWAPGQLSMLRTESRLMAMLRGKTVPDRADFVLMRRSKKLGMELETDLLLYLAELVPNEPLLGQFADVCMATFANGSQLVDGATAVVEERRVARRNEVEAELRLEAFRADRAVEKRLAAEAQAMRARAADQRRVAAAERAARDAERKARVRETREVFREKLAAARAQLALVEESQAQAYATLERVEQMIRGDPYSGLEYAFGRALDAGEWPALREAILALIGASESRAAITLQRNADRLKLTELVNDDDLIVRLLAADEDVQPNLAELARDILMG